MMLRKLWLEYKTVVWKTPFSNLVRWKNNNNVPFVNEEISCFYHFKGYDMSKSSSSSSYFSTGKKKKGN